MGNIESHPQPQLDRKLRLPRKKSASNLLRRKLSCISFTNSDDGTQSSGTIHVDSKGSLKEAKDSSPNHSSLDLPLTPPEFDAAHIAYLNFLHMYPEYLQTSAIDLLRKSDYTRLALSGETYLDYMGGSLYPEGLVKDHSNLLMRSIMGNTHSISNSSMLSTSLAAEARAAVLQFFDATSDYTVVFTANASTALKLVGESYPFRPGGSLVLGVDSHNSVNGIREFAMNKNARVRYICPRSHGGINIADAERVLLENKPDNLGCSPSLFTITGLSNISNTKTSLSVARYASSLGYHTLLDAAALAATSAISLKTNPVDAMAVSFYKMFGFPTGIGALVVKKSFLRELQRPWFAGGTVDVVQVPGSLVTMAKELQEQFEDGTINYTMLPAVTGGLRYLSSYMPLLPIRLSSLLHYFISQLMQIRHDVTDTPVVRILSRLPKIRVQRIGEQMDTGSTVSLLFVDPNGDIIPNSFIEFAASQQKISLRTGCVCNPGGASVLLGIQESMNYLEEGVTLDEYERRLGRELGVVRMSLGFVSSFEDVWRALDFARLMASEKQRSQLWAEWIEMGGRHSHAAE